MFRTTYRQARSRIHHAPVENRERQITIKANKKQTLFFALSSLQLGPQETAVTSLYSVRPSRRRSSSCHPASAIIARSVPIGNVAFRE
jgi:hypothetical protein